MSSLSFYASLEARHASLKEALRQADRFSLVPEDWQVIVTDIQGSTKAVGEGRYRDVNTIAASCVIACLNIAKKHPGLQIPFLYGGDGATLLVPHDVLPEMLAALKALRANVATMYGLPLRVGSVGVKKVYEAGKTLRLAKLSVAPGYDQAVFLGDGLVFADKYIKADLTTAQIEEDMQLKDIDLNGLTCRWNEIKPRGSMGEVVCAIIQATNVEHQPEVYAEVLEILDRVYGPYHERHPVTVKALSPSLLPQNFRRASTLSSGHFRPVQILKEAIHALGSTLVFGLSLQGMSFDPRKYLREMIAATDTLHLSGTLYTIVMGNETQRLALREALDQMERDGRLVYGTASCSASVATCYVQKYNAGHIHFLDGAGGGYTQASKELKPKLAALS